MSFVPTRRFLKLPAWTWLLLPLSLMLVIVALGEPGPPSEPRVDEVIFQTPVLVTKNKAGFRTVPYGFHKGFAPLWKITANLDAKKSATSVQWRFGWVDHQLIFGLYRREAKWYYALSSVPFAGGPQDGRAAWPELSEPDLQHVRPLVIADLNQRSPEGQLGEALDKVLTDGIEQVSYECPQNIILALLGISLVLALVAVWMMFHDFEPAANDRPDGPA